MGLVRAGLDEVGIGAWSGPFLAAVTVFREKDLTLLPQGVKDSKKTTEAERGMMYFHICSAAFDVGIGHAWPWEIDRMGYSDALQLTYRRALGELRCSYDELIIDGNVGVKDFRGIYKPPRITLEPKADVNYREVSAASIVAKWFRDQIMISYSKLFPQYGWDENKGYGTAAHTAAIKQHGLLIDDANFNRYFHRKQYCKKFINGGL